MADISDSGDAQATSRWSSTSTVDSAFESFWDDDLAIPDFYTTEDTVVSLDPNGDDFLFKDSGADSSMLQPGHELEGIQTLDFGSTGDLSFDDVTKPSETVSEPLNGSSADEGVQVSSHLPSSMNSSMKEMVKSSLCRGDGGRLFLPMDALRRIFTKDRILTELQTLYPYLPVEALRRIAQQIADDGEGSSTGFRKVFATLLLTDQADKISLFLNENVNDTDLALQKVAADNAFELRRRTAPDAPLGCFQGWTQSDIEAFEKRQWLFLSPVFDKKQGLKPLDLEDKRILPFTESTEHQIQDHFRGGNSEVFRVKLHPAHYNFDQRWFSDFHDQPSFAVKKLLSVDEDTFRREVEAFQQLQTEEHSNVISLLATYKYKGYYHLVFPWANGDLRRLWQNQPEPPIGPEGARWIAAQCSGIASALNHVHNGAISAAAHPLTPHQLYGLHGDIKPENIFVFSQPGKSAPAGKLVVGDFGGGFFYNANTNPDPLRQITNTYRPPEHDTKSRPMSRSWDVWGLGCTYLEFVTWFLQGTAGLSEFAKKRTTFKNPGVYSDEYFETINPGETGALSAFLKGTVLEWITELYNHKSSSQFTRDFLEFITNRMFVVETALTTRASGAEVALRLEALAQRCFEDDSYCQPSPSGKAPWDVESVDDIVTSSSSSSDLSPESFTANFFNTPDDYPISPLNRWNTFGAAGGISDSPMDFLLVDKSYLTAPALFEHDAQASAERKRKREAEDHAAAKRRNSPLSTDSVDATAVATSGSKTGEKKFACPFYKNNPGTFRQKRTCCGPGWPTVHRVK
ncbi:putative fad binding domain protein [Phaeoacremonium minimum UCRPA7]|uniref:Putative fad binding domain protein n=1 Tax=Phaeoacremonium minimum (strain UCR-PA7) TaxID=1286976 RepID=R8BJQ5_PHAM7|nr:putative fad binding domain protein [Phaeoacremonium minimum UCRPA7]EON99447.1 putative fad binding domain protein [Phaeoacremonium minimum UCRPA7]